LAVPRSTAMSRPRKASALLMKNENLPEGSCPVIYCRPALAAPGERALAYILHGQVRAA
jgi:hypothetical protein